MAHFCTGNEENTDKDLLALWICNTITWNLEIQLSREIQCFHPSFDYYPINFVDFK